MVEAILGLLLVDESFRWSQMCRHEKTRKLNSLRSNDEGKTSKELSMYVMVFTLFIGVFPKQSKCFSFIPTAST